MKENILTLIILSLIISVSIQNTVLLHKKEHKKQSEAKIKKRKLKHTQKKRYRKKLSKKLSVIIDKEELEPEEQLIILKQKIHTLINNLLEDQELDIDIQDALNNIKLNLKNNPQIDIIKNKINNNENDDEEDQNQNNKFIKLITIIEEYHKKSNEIEDKEIQRLSQIDQTLFVITQKKQNNPKNVFAVLQIASEK